MLCISVSDDYLIVEYNWQAFQRLHNLQQRLTNILQVAGLHDDLLLDMMQYPCATFYKGDGYSDIDSWYMKYERCHKTVVPQKVKDLENRNGVMICFLESEFGHLSNLVIFYISSYLIYRNNNLFKTSL